MNSTESSLGGTRGTAEVLDATPETLIFSSTHENGSWNEHHVKEPESLSFILIPLLIVLGVAFVSGLAVYCIQRRQRLDNLRHTLIPLYTFKAADEDEWGVLLDNCSSNNGSDNNHYQSR